MENENDKYYVLFEEWSMDPNQWSIVIDSIAVILAILGVLFGLILYRKQRQDNSKDAYDFFQSSLPELKQSIVQAIADLKEFNRSLDLDDFVNPILSATLNDKFLNKINLVDLHRYFTNNAENKLPQFKQLLIDSNFFGDYHAYITQEINYFRNNYMEKKKTFSKWKVLSSEKFFAAIDNETESAAYKNFYTTWIKNFNRNRAQVDQQHLKTMERELFIEEQMKKLTSDILPFINENSKANEVHLTANNVIAAYHKMTEMKLKIKDVLEKDITRFEKVLHNLNVLLDQK